MSKKSWLTVIVSVVVFVGLLILFLTMASLMRPAKAQVLAATRDLQPGDTIHPGDLQAIEVYEDERIKAYIPANRLNDIAGGVVSYPVSAGEPIPAAAVLSVGTSDNRLAGVLAQFPDYTLFPLPLDRSNIVAPDIRNFHTGDIVALTIVYPDRPQLPEPPRNTAGWETSMFANGSMIATPTLAPTPTPMLATYPDRGFPPVAKTLSTAGFRVIQVFGMPPDPAQEDSEGVSYASLSQQPEPMITVLVPKEQMEELSLALIQGKIIVSFVWQDTEHETGGYSYWDFEHMLKAERERLEALTPTPVPTATPTP